MLSYCVYFKTVFVYLLTYLLTYVFINPGKIRLDAALSIFRGKWELCLSLSVTITILLPLGVTH